MSERPFFIVGAPRSGTTLLRFVFSSHPRICIPAETGFLPYLGVSPEEALEPDGIGRLLDRIGRLNRDWHGMVDDRDGFIASLPEPRLGPVLAALYRLKCEPHGAARWGDKTPSYVLHIPTLVSIFPDAQFVHLIRDGRDVALSAAAKWGRQRRYMDSMYLLKNWVRHVEQGRAAGRSLGSGQYLEIRYETLVQQPKPVVERLCDFLGEAFHPSMLDHTRLARRQIMPGGHTEVWQPISAASVGRWRSDLRPFDQKVADRVAGSLLTTLGYELANAGRMSFSEQAIYRVRWLRYALLNSGRQVSSRLGLLKLNRGKRLRRR